MVTQSHTLLPSPCTDSLSLLTLLAKLTKANLNFSIRVTNILSFIYFFHSEGLRKNHWRISVFHEYFVQHNAMLTYTI